MTTTTKASSLTSVPHGAGLSPQRLALFDQFPYGLMILGGGGQLLELNGPSAKLLGVDHATVRNAPTRCCDLVCGRAAETIDPACLTSHAVDASLPPIEVEIEVGAAGGPRSAWVTACEIATAPTRVLFHLRPGVYDDDRPVDAIAPAGVSDLRIRTLGSLRVETESAAIDGDWLQQRPGELFKYLICNRLLPLQSEQIAEALWPNASQHEALTSVRQYVHQLRNNLEPDRGPRSTSSHVITRRGGYTLVYGWLDADEFELHVERGLQAMTRGHDAEARAELIAAGELYGGDFLVDDRYAEWALVERDRLRELASRALRALIALEVEAGALELALDHARDLADMDPFDMDVHRDHLSICLRLGRRSEAVRRYAVLSDRMRRRFDEEPEFTLRELAADAAPLGRLDLRSGAGRSRRFRDTPGRAPSGAVT